MSSFHIEYIYRPASALSEDALQSLVTELRAVGATCFDPLPDYQVFRGTREELDDKVLTLARHKVTGKLLGFCSAVLLPMKDYGEVLHLGLTCVSPMARGLRLTHALTSTLTLRYLARRLLWKPWDRVWVTSVACVLSSLGNTALFFDDVFPSPFGAPRPGVAHVAIAREFSARFRDKAHILPTAALNEATFVFEGSVEGTVFEKEVADPRFHHRDPALNDFYRGLLCFERGDEVIQVGCVTLGTALRYLWRGSVRSRRTERPDWRASSTYRAPPR